LFYQVDGMSSSHTLKYDGDSHLPLKVRERSVLA